MPYTKGKRMAEGKTKIVWASAFGQGSCILESKDEITAGDGAKHDVIAGKAKLANTTTCNVFRLLQDCGLPLAFRERIDDTSFAADYARMILLEIVIRREAHGSYLKRAPFLMRGHVFPRLLFEIFLKTSDKKWREHTLPCDDPLLVRCGGNMHLYLPGKPLWDQPEPFLTFSEDSVPALARAAEIEDLARRVFLVLEKAWQMQGVRLVDFKIEFGLTREGQLVVADVIDSDSWRIVGPDGNYIDKQAYRDGGELAAVYKLFKKAAALTEKFTLPRQRIVLWSGSDTDDLTEYSVLDRLANQGGLEVVRIARSAHKQTVATICELHRLVQEVSDTVIIASVGRSNGLGPILAANSTVPVITVPNTKDSKTDVYRDVWSALNMPSDVPVLTAINPANAIQAAQIILSGRNPYQYMLVRLKQEQKFMNPLVLD